MMPLVMHPPAHDEPIPPSCDTPAEGPSAAAPGGGPSPSAPRRIESTELLAGANEVLIAHGAETYRLRLTRSGKLILHK